MNRCTLAAARTGEPPPRRHEDGEQSGEDSAGQTVLSASRWRRYITEALLLSSHRSFLSLCSDPGDLAPYAPSKASIPVIIHYYEALDRRRLHLGLCALGLSRPHPDHGSTRAGAGRRHAAGFAHQITATSPTGFGLDASLQPDSAGRPAQDPSQRAEVRPSLQPDRAPLRRRHDSRRLDKPLPDDLDDTGLLPWRRALFAKPPPSLAEDEPKPVDPMVRLGLAAANHRVRRSTDALFSTPGTNATGVPGFVEVAYPLAYSNLAKTVAGLVYSINSDRNDTGFDLGTSPSQSTQFWLSPAGNASDSDSASQNTFELKVPIVDAASLVASEYCATFPVGPEGEMSLQPCGETDGYSQRAPLSSVSASKRR